jgi:hypothetical protein
MSEQIESVAVQYKSTEMAAIHGRLCTYAKQRSALDAAELFDLARAEHMRIHVWYGGATHFEYMERTLGYRPHAARERMRVARALVKLPQTSVQLAEGALSYSAVRELTRVAIDETEAEWLDAAKGKTVHEIEALVSGHAMGDVPDDPTHPDLRTRIVRLELTPEAFAAFRQARSALEAERGGEVSDADLVETMARRILDPGTGEEGPAQQIAYKQCRDCKRATQNGAGREIDVGAHAIARAHCDARMLGSLDATKPERAKTTVTARMREHVFARDDHRCTVPGCRSARNLDIHHIIEQSAGGPHELWNITLICSGHHAALHAGHIKIIGRAPQLAVSWVTLPPLPPGLGDVEREAANDALGEAAAQRVFSDVPRGTWDEIVARTRRTALRDPVPREELDAVARILARGKRHPLPR